MMKSRILSYGAFSATGTNTACKITWLKGVNEPYHLSNRKVTQLNKYHFSGEAIQLFFLIRVFKIEESETENTCRMSDM
jgi:hypothetical protein